MTACSNAILKIENLQVSVANAAQTPVVRGLSYTLEKGKVLAVVGESGCGKSLHALSILRILPPGVQITGGHIIYGEKDILQLPAEELRQLRGHKIAMVFQDPMTSLNPIRTIGKQLTETILAHQKCSKLRAQARAIRLLKKVGIPDARKRMKEYPFQFSGGQRQRIMIAMALCLNPDILIADEPTTALDVTIQAQILELIKKLQMQRDMSAVFITHNLAIVSNVADEVLVLYGGYCMEKARCSELFAHPLHPYTKGLLGSLLSLSGEKPQRLPAIEGYPPAPGTPEKGCPFAPRCPQAMEKCFAQLPPLSEQAGHQVRCWLQEKNA
ncbi:MAG: ABC transporter ATP-binding protein [Elusimicrobiaceae bacterium]|nr:ABC transporter ATP-binding protein [Elusimicrobiaceae bacterium]